MKKKTPKKKKNSKQNKSKDSGQKVDNTSISKNELPDSMEQTQIEKNEIVNRIYSRFKGSIPDVIIEDVYDQTGGNFFQTIEALIVMYASHEENDVQIETVFESEMEKE